MSCSGTVGQHTQSRKLILNKLFWLVVRHTDRHVSSSYIEDHTAFASVCVGKAPHLAFGAVQAANLAGWVTGLFIHLTGVLVMKHVICELKHFTLDESGATAIEYGLVVALISVMIVAGAFAIGTSLSTIFLKISACLKTPTALTCVP